MEKESKRGKSKMNRIKSGIKTRKFRLLYAPETIVLGNAILWIIYFMTEESFHLTQGHLIFSIVVMVAALISAIGMISFLRKNNDHPLGGIIPLFVLGCIVVLGLIAKSTISIAAFVRT